MREKRFNWMEIEVNDVGASLGWNKHGTLFIRLGERVSCLGKRRLKKYNERPNKSKMAKDLLGWVTWDNNLLI